MQKLNKLGIAAEEPTLKVFILVAMVVLLFIVLYLIIFKVILGGILQ